MSVEKIWVGVIHQLATGTRKSRALLTPVGIVIFGGFSTLFVLAAILADRWLGLPDLLPSTAALALSIPVTAAGAALTAWSAAHFLKVKGTPVPFNPPPKLVKTGPYRYSRNPMLVGMFLTLFGVGFAVNSVSLVLFFTPLYVLANYWELKRIEEPELIKRLGDAYVAYRNKTPMFIPRLRNTGGSGTRL